MRGSKRAIGRRRLVNRIHSSSWLFKLCCFWPLLLFSNAGLRIHSWRCRPRLLGICNKEVGEELLMTLQWTNAYWICWIGFWIQTRKGQRLEHVWHGKCICHWISEVGFNCFRRLEVGFGFWGREDQGLRIKEEEEEEEWTGGWRSDQVAKTKGYKLNIGNWKAHLSKLSTLMFV